MMMMRVMLIMMTRTMVMGDADNAVDDAADGAGDGAGAGDDDADDDEDDDADLDWPGGLREGLSGEGPSEGQHCPDLGVGADHSANP